MKIGILGSSFDPPHIGHILIARQVREILELNQIWLMPNYKHAFGKIQTPPKKRLAMTKLIEEEFIKVSSIEIKKRNVSYTIDTLNYCREKFPGDEFFWILGSDQLDSFIKYKNWKELVRNYSLVIFPRESIQSKLIEKTKKALGLQNIPKNITVMDNKKLILTNISSSMIRERVNKNLSIKFLVPKKVEEYILKNKFYEK